MVQLMGYFNISGLEPIGEGLRAIAKALAGPERQQDYALTPVAQIPDISQERPSSATGEDILAWMMNQPRLTSGGNTGIILSGFVRSCAQAHGIDLEKVVMDRVGKGPAGSR